MISKSDYLKILKYLETKIGHQKSELNYTNPFTFAVAVLLSAQATDKGVNLATPELFELYDTPKKMVALGLDGLKKYVKSINYFNNKSKHIIMMSEQLIEKFGGHLPRTKAELESLAGIGTKSANVIMNELYGAATIAVDTHVIRVSNRLDLLPAPTQDPKKIEAVLEQITPQKYKRYLGNYLVLFGRYTCIARKPKCEECGLRGLCKWYRENKL